MSVITMETTNHTTDIPNFVRTMFLDGVNRRASDIHIDPSINEVRIRFRVDGSLAPYISFPMSYHDQLLTHLKVLSELNTTSVFTPQDGHFALSFLYEDKDPAKNKPMVIDIRISVFPTIYGDSAVFRITNSISHILSLDQLGMDPVTLEKVRSITRRNNGMMLVTGPVGSGKTSALYAALDETMTEDKNVITLEDPVEFRFDKIRQIQMNPDRGLTFASGMKSVLRQDPDTIMIGEIRDAETAEYAMRAALVGRTVFSTLHSNSSTGTIARLIDMNIEKSMIAYAINGVISTRLVKKNCEFCKVEYVPAQEFLLHFKINPSEHHFVHGAGCEKCDNKGFFGRTGIFEVLEFDTKLRSMIVEGKSMADLELYVATSGTKLLRADALEKVYSGITTLENIAIVL